MRLKKKTFSKKEKVVITFRLNELDQKYKIECSIADKNLKIKKIVLDFDPLLIDFFAQRFSEFYNKSREIV